MRNISSLIFLWMISVMLITQSSCKKDTSKPNHGSQDTVVVTPPSTTFDVKSINDTYADIAPFSNYLKWTVYNVHDPSIKKFGDTYYCYSTDVAYGTDVRPGIQIRKSKDLVQWQFVGWVFNSLPQQGAQYIKQKSGTPFNSLWAPYVLKVGNEYRLYYSLSCSLPRLSVIGLATSSSPEGPWVERGVVVSSANDNIRQTNAIDPTVLVTSSGAQWMYYGSAWDGIYILKLDPITGMAASPGDKGKRIANRGFTNGVYNGNIEGPEVVYNPQLNKYFLFISYDWLETKYNIRVGRADNPEGPFYDFNGHDINLDEDHGPMIVAPYKFQGHGGWQGTAHCSVFDDGANNFYLAHQGRPGVDKYFMDLHIRKVFWTADGWPIVSPERYAATKQSVISQSDVIGKWEKITLNYQIVPGYANEQTSPDFQSSVDLNLNADGTLDSNLGNWNFTDGKLQLNFNDGNSVDLFVERGWDWEKKQDCLVFSGLDKKGIAIWGKKS